MATLLLENGPDKGKGLELKPGETYTLGRDAACQIVVQGDLISRQHCRVKEFKGAYYVKDLDSLNGVFLNDQRVNQAELKSGDKLQLGDVVLTFLDESLAKSKEEKTLGGYRLLERVGRGGMGTVYRAIQISLDREVALKVLSPDLVKDQAFVEQFFREARAAGQLNHPHIVQVYDVGQEGDTFYYSMEYVRGGSLEDRLRAEGKLPVAEALRIALEAAMALEYAQSRGIVHRDIKPDNLMLAEDGRVRVADLGLALSLKSSADHKGQPILGTPHFISPEQALRREIDIRSDLYSLGATIYRMLAGRTVFTGASAEEIVKKAVREEPQPLRELNPEVPEKVAALVHRLLRKNPDERFESARELREALEKLTRHPGRTKALIAAVSVAAIAVVAAVVFALNKPEPEKVIVESGDVLAARRNEYNAKSESDKRKIELEAVRAYLVLFETPRDRTALKEALAAWQKNYDYLELPEKTRAGARVHEIEAELEREAEAQRQAESARAELLTAARDGVRGLEATGAFVAALLRASAIDPGASTDEATRSALAAEKEHLVAEVAEKLEADRARRLAEIDAAVAERRFADAAAACSEGEKAWTIDGAPPAEPLGSALAAVRDEFKTRRETLEKQASEAQEAVVVRDRARRAEAFAAPTRQAILALDLAAAADRIDAVTKEVETEPVRAELQPIARSLRSGAALIERVLARLEAGTLPTEPQFRLAGSDKPADLAGFDREKRLVKLTTKASRGASSSSVPLSELANANALRQLVLGRVELSPAEMLDLADLMTTIEVIRWVEGLAPLADRAARYDARTGWTDDLRQGLTASADPQLADEVTLVLKDLPSAQLDAAAGLRTRAMQEEQSHAALVDALDPFLHRDSTIGWAASRDALARLLNERRETLLLRIVSPWIAGT